MFWARLLLLLNTSKLFTIMVNELVGYADDSNLIAVVPSPGMNDFAISSTGMTTV